MTVASTGNLVKRKWHNKKKHHPNGQQQFNKIPKHVLQAALNKNNTAVPKVSRYCIFHAEFKFAVNPL